MIDTLARAERLEREYGDDPERARRHARILGDMLEAGDVATKQDIQELRTELRAGLHEVEQRLRAELHKKDRLDRVEVSRFAFGSRSRDRGSDQAVARELITIGR